MSGDGASGVGRRALARLEEFIGGGGFPVFVLCLLLAYEALLVALLLIPGGETGLGAFAEDFRVWCFGYDPATGRLEWGYVLGMTAPPTLLGAVAVLLWWEPLRAWLARPRALVAPALAAGLLVTAAAGALAAIGASSERGELPFPAESLRTAHRPPALRLVNHLGQPTDLAELRGKVVLLTGVYAACPHTCPLILDQARRAVAALEPSARDDLRVVAVTLDPERESQETLASLAQLHSLEALLYQFVTGPPAEVERVLDQMGIIRHRDPATGIIDHASLFLVIDRAGTVAYRMTLGDRQERWLVSALQLLLREPADGA